MLLFNFNKIIIFNCLTMWEEKKKLEELVAQLAQDPCVCTKQWRMTSVSQEF